MSAKDALWAAGWPQQFFSHFRFLTHVFSILRSLAISHYEYAYTCGFSCLVVSEEPIVALFRRAFSQFSTVGCRKCFSVNFANGCAAASSAGFPAGCFAAC